MPRKRSIADADLLEAALALVRELGPEALTFGALSARTGLAASTIVQRFGRKPALLRAALLRAWDHLDDLTAAADREARPGLDGVIDLLVHLSGQYDPSRYADQLLLLREDLRDPILRGRGRAWLGTLTETVERRLADVPGGAAGLGEMVVAQWQGSLTIWGFTPDEPLGVAVRERLGALLERVAAPPGS